ncbi:MAG: helix-hairpin-helix domain-containing protein [Gemmatimonadales bacterium]
MQPLPEHARVATLLRDAARLLEEQHASPFRVAAYRRAADAVEALNTPVAGLIDRHPGLESVPGIGPRLAATIRGIVESNRFPLLERLASERDFTTVVATLPGVGPHLARRIVSELGVESLEELEVAVADGRLGRLRGFGVKRVAGIRDALAGRLRTSPARQLTRTPPPPVEELLDVDREYRRRIDTLPRIAPRRFNPAREAWLPVLHTSRGGHRYTALFSNTARAHQLGRTRDWVVLYFDGPDGEGRATVVTARYGVLRGRRVVRGREASCARFYGLWTEPKGEILRFDDVA